MSWRPIHFHETDVWTGAKVEIKYSYMTTNAVTYLRAPDGSIKTINKCNKPSEVKNAIRPEQKSKTVIKHTTLDTVNILVVARDLYIDSPLYLHQVFDVFDKLKINPDLYTKLVLVVEELGLMTQEVVYNGGWRDLKFTVKNPQSLFDES